VTEFIGNRCEAEGRCLDLRSHDEEALIWKCRPSSLVQLLRMVPFTKSRRLACPGSPSKSAFTAAHQLPTVEHVLAWTDNDHTLP
jgi:hypothetical protein